MFMIIFLDVKCAAKINLSRYKFIPASVILFFDSIVDFMINRFSINACALSLSSR